jgi:VWFA-related protein
VLSVVCVAAAAAQSPPSANALRLDLYAVRDGAPVEDLRQDELQILEDDVPQVIESFEHVAVVPGSARSRAFVLFVDTLHTTIEDEPSAKLPLVRLLDRLIGRDDLVAMMTPELAAGDLTFGRKADALSNLMQAEWGWARRGRRREPGSKEVLYEQCFDSSQKNERERGLEMQARWREQTTLDALDDMVAHLATTRHERTTVLTISNGWQLFSPSRTLGQPDDERDSRSERRRRFGDRGSRQGSPATPVMRVECEADRRRLALLDHPQRLRDLTEAANRATVSFYPLYAPEVTVPPEGTSRPVPDATHTAARQDSLRLLADGTDGQAALRRTGIDDVLTRIAADASSYYLVTYRSTNTKLDGRFRALSARSTRPGVRLRLRRGYRGPTADELLSGRRPVRDPGAPAAGVAVAPVNDAARTFRIHTASWRSPAGGTFWVVGEIDYRTRRELAWTAGAKADIRVLASDGRELMAETVAVRPGDGAFTIRVPEQGAVEPGEYAVQVQLRPDANDSLVLADTARVVVTASRAEELGAPIIWRRGPSTGPRHVKTADVRFSRSDRIRLEMPTTVPGTAAARLLDRAGQPIQVPVQISAREDESGQFRWIVADAALAPLAPGQYTIEVTLGALRQAFALVLVP